MIMKIKTKLHYFSHCFHSLKMKYKLILIFMTTFSIALLAITSIYSYIYQHDMSQSTIEVFEQTASSYSNLLVSLLNSIDAVAETPLYSATLQSELKSHSTLSEDSRFRMHQATSSLPVVNRHKYLILLYNTAGQIVFSDTSASYNISNSEYYFTWQNTAQTKNGTTFFSPINDTDTKYAFTAVKQIKSTQTFTPVGLAVIAVPKDILINMCSSITQSTASRILLFNSDNEPIFDVGKNVGESLPDEIKKYLYNNDTVTNTIINSATYLSYYQKQQNDKYKILIYTKKSNLFQSLYQTKLINWIIMISITLIFAFFIVLIANSITHPLRIITNLMKTVQQGDLTVRFNPKYTDEVGILGSNFDQMLCRIQDLILQVTEAETRQKKSEIDALKGQINPHFIYNTLETFRMMAVETDNFELADNIATFGKIMRYNITLMNEITTIREEIKYLQYYIKIQNCRFNQQIELSTSINTPLEEHPIIKLLIQPIVENAIIHAHPNSLYKILKIQILAYRAENTCVIEIRDDGSGMSSTQLQTIYQKLNSGYQNSNSTKSIGLINVKERINLYYGSSYGLYVNSTPQKGTIVKIILPYKL